VTGCWNQLDCANLFQSDRTYVNKASRLILFAEIWRREGPRCTWILRSLGYWLPDEEAGSSAATSQWRFLNENPSLAELNCKIWVLFVHLHKRLNHPIYNSRGGDSCITFPIVCTLGTSCDMGTMMATKVVSLMHLDHADRSWLGFPCWLGIPGFVNAQYSGPNEGTIGTLQSRIPFPFPRSRFGGKGSSVSKLMNICIILLSRIISAPFPKCSCWWIETARRWIESYRLFQRVHLLKWGSPFPFSPT
jgi:hypothetical protein